LVVGRGWAVGGGRVGGGLAGAGVGEGARRRRGAKIVAFLREGGREGGREGRREGRCG